MEAVFNNIQQIIQNRHEPAFVVVFICGLISAASPCVLAAIPLIIGYVLPFQRTREVRPKGLIWGFPLLF
jgi:cytochrome c biogenesis protein CcdA